MQILNTGIIAAVLIFTAKAAAQEPAIIAAGSQVAVRLTLPIDTAHAHDGEEFAASLDAPLLAGDFVLAPRGAGAVVRFQASPKPSLTLISFTVHGVRYAIETHSVAAADPAVTKTSHGALKGAAIGAIGGGLIAGRIGIPLGAGAGAAAGSFMRAKHNRHPRIPAETRIEFLLEKPLSIKTPERSK